MTVRTVAIVALSAVAAGILLTVTANAAFDIGFRVGVERAQEASKPCRALTI